MNTIMKQLYRFIIASVAFSAAALISGPNLDAQNLPEEVYLEEDGICFRKTATQNPDGKSYTIDLESFVKGAVHYVESADPSDIVLVLDVSGSMNNNITSYKYVEATTPTNVTYDNRYYNLESNQNQRYIKYENDYYRVRVGSYQISDRYWDWDSWSWIPAVNAYYLYFQVGNTQYYIDNSGNIGTTRPTNVTDSGTNLLASSVQLYSRQTETKTRLKALQDATVAFIGEVEKNAKYDKKGQERTTYLDHQIAIVKFAQGYYNSNSEAWQEVDNGNHFSGQSNCTEVVRGLKSVLTQKDDLINAVNSFRVNGNYGQTSADYGMHLAENIINHIPADRVSNKTVVFFTDGEPYREGYNNVNNDAIFNSHAIKIKTYTKKVIVDGVEKTEESHPQVFSVGVFTTAPDPTDPTDQIYVFMDRISSDYPDATSMTNTCTKESSDFYKDASGGAADLDAIFKAIAGAASSQESNIGSSSAVTVDVVTNSFSVPNNAEEAELEVLVAPCTGSKSITYKGETKEYLTFGDPVAPEDAGEDFAGVTITPTVDPKTNTVSTTGFDFGKYFCGKDDSGSTTSYRGWKQVIRFKINLKDEAVGGPNVATNDESSGIYVNGEQLAKFNRPTVAIPVQIWIQKIGLQDDDSAVFTLYATPYVEDQKEEVYRSEDYDQYWKTFTKVIVNKENMVEITDPNNPDKTVKVVKLVGLDPHYFYRLKEDAWAFGYQYQTNEGVVDTIGDEIHNPIKIENKPKDIHFDEAVVRNVFQKKEATTGGNTN